MTTGRRTPGRLLVFARAPRRGEVKQRLAAEVGAEAALQAHRRLVTDTLERLSGMDGVVTELWVAGVAGIEVRRWANTYGVRLRAQTGADLGERMHQGLLAGLAASSRVVLVGSDCPEIDRAYVRKAIGLLDGYDVVLGPAEDGGYGLIGVRRGVESDLTTLFSGVAWGESSVLPETRRRCAGAGLEVALLPVIWDVDDATGWRRFLALREGPDG
jgi:rSAM/selenodomain-associated transferase 1